MKNFPSQLHTLQLGQCLPETCTLPDVKQILTLDPAAVTLNAKTPNKIVVLSVRRIPGEYSILDDTFFHFLMYGL